MPARIVLAVWGGILLLVGFPSSTEAQHLLVQIEKNGDDFRVVKATRVELPLPKRRDTQRTYPWRVLVRGKKGKVLHQAGMRDPTVLRGEFQNRADPGKIDAHHLKQKEPLHFSIRIPLMEAKQVEFRALGPDAKRVPRPPDEAYERIGSVPYPGGED